VQNILNNIQSFYSKEQPFVAYRKPNSAQVIGLFMNSCELCYTDSFSEEGFVFAPFNTQEKSIVFSKQKANFIQETFIDVDYPEVDTVILSHSKDQKHKHIELVTKAVNFINEGNADKVVISRKEEFTISTYKLEALFVKLLKMYENAFVYLWYHPKVGLWLGATPETLLSIKNTSFETMSLAGTKNANDANGQWTTKELEEQKIVTNYIVNQLNEVSENLQVHKLETVRAGNLHHLKNKITGTLSLPIQIENVIKALHPTPAICGLPKEIAKQFILENEAYPRSYYSGFLGECFYKSKSNDAVSTSLYVNLRCMSIANEKAAIYVGGGIIKNSNPELEWEETVSKSKTMKSLFQ
jgi:isochorismate synthase